MNKELLNKILPYCGHGLKVAYEDSIVKAEISKFVQMCEPSEDGEYFKPVLFPPDCLTREIETEYGKEIPLIEIIRAHWPSDSKLELRDDGIVRSEHKSGITLLWSFVGDNLYFGTTDSYCPFWIVPPHWKIYQYLYSRHIALGLKPDEYVSVESLEKNPYKIK